MIFPKYFTLLNIISVYLFASCLFWNLGAQSGQIHKPRIMVLPAFNENQNPAKILENSAVQRLSVTKFQELLISNNAYVIDVLATIKGIETDNLLNDNVQENIKSKVLDYSGADVYVELELTPIDVQSYGKAMQITPKIYDAFTQELLATTVFKGDSPTKSTDTLHWVSATINKSGSNGEITNLMKTIQTKFDETATYGRNIKMTVIFENNNYNLDKLTKNGETIGNLIENWVADENNSNSYDDVRYLTNKMIFPGIRIPFLNAKGRTNKPSAFIQALTSYLNTIILESGNKISASSTAVGGKITLILK